MPENETPPAPDAGFFQSKWWRYGRLALVALLPLFGAVAKDQGCPRTVTVIETIDRVVVVEKLIPPEDFTPTMGWVRDESVIEKNLDDTQTLHFGQTPAGKVVQGDEDVFLWRAVRKVAHLDDSHYPNVNQQSVGCCVGCGWKHSSDVVQATAILSGQRFDWKPISVEVIYAGSRVDVGGGRISGDGSVGAWAAEYMKAKGGLCPMEKIGNTDLSTFSPARARQWGKSGAPAEVKAVAKVHPVKGVALVTSWADAKRAISQGYPIAVCSNQGFTMERDATGRCRPQGSWGHCMAVIGVRSARDGRTEGGFILNSWGDKAHTGPVWPPDAPVAGFWADAAVIDRMLKQGDSFALADVAGFPARKVIPDWFVQLRPEFAPFQNEVALCW